MRNRGRLFPLGDVAADRMAERVHRKPLAVALMRRTVAGDGSDRQRTHQGTFILRLREAIDRRQAREKEKSLRGVTGSNPGAVNMRMAVEALPMLS